jgi:hypothetical protein
MLVSTAFITNIKKVKKKKKIILSSPTAFNSSLLPTHLLIHFLRASSEQKLFTAVFTENNQCQEM